MYYPTDHMEWWIFYHMFLSLLVTVGAALCAYATFRQWVMDRWTEHKAKQAERRDL